MNIPKEWLDFLREQYPAGSRIKLREMGADDPCPIQPGAMGTLQCIDDMGTFHVAWDNGRGLGLVIGQDSFTVLPPPLHTLKLYMPLTVGYFENDGDGWSDEEYTLGSDEAVKYAPQIMAAMESERRWLIDYGESHGTGEAERGLMACYGKLDSVEQKVHSCWFTAEVRDGQLWGVAECRICGELTAEELAQLKEEIEGQAADGFGESVEQHEIRVDGGMELYAHLWHSGKDWDIQTEQERFGPKLADGLPEMCFSTLAGTGELICIKRGESGYYRSDWNTSDRDRNQEIADEGNQSLGVTAAQRKAMEAGSMFGWGCPAADPKNYKQEQTGAPAEAQEHDLDGESGPAMAMGGMDFA